MKLRKRVVRLVVRLSIPVAGAVSMGAMVGAAWAQNAPADAGTDAASTQAAAPNNGKRVCVNAEVNGVQALSYDCLSQQLAPTPSAAASGISAAEALAKSPSNQVGTFNYSAESIRFGNAWGKSATPQRPGTPAPAPVK
ncbi:hypothetical protein [Paraburkholderia sp. 2C]